MSDFNDGIEKAAALAFEVCQVQADGWRKSLPDNKEAAIAASNCGLFARQSILALTRPTPDRSEARERIARSLLAQRGVTNFQNDGTEKPAYRLMWDDALRAADAILATGLVQDEASPVETISGRAYGLDVIDSLSKRKLTCRELARYIWDRAQNTPMAFEQDIARLIANERRQAVERSEASIRADEREKCAHIFEVRRNLSATDAEIASPHAKDAGDE